MSETKNQYLTKNNKKCDTKLTAVGIFILCIGLLVLLRNVFYGTNQSDDSFYFTIPYRLILGDSLFADEWHVSQLSSFFQVLPFAVFFKVTGSADGIILFFRLLYVLCQTLVSGFVFWKMRKYGFISAVFSSLVFFLYSPEFITTLNYYTMSLMAIAIICMLLFTDEKITAFKLYFSGVLLACAVICEPTLVFLFIAYICACIVFSLKKARFHPVFELRSLFRVCLGIGTAAAVFFAFIFSMEAPAELLSDLPNIFINKEYSAGSMVKYGELFKTLLSFWPLTVMSFAWVILIAGFKIKNKKNIDKKIKIRFLISGLFIALLFSVYFVVRILKKQCTDIFFINYIWFFLSLGLLLLSEKKDRDHVIIWVIGFIDIAALGFVSQATMITGFTGAAITQFTLAPVFFNFINELKNEESRAGSSKRIRMTMEMKKKVERTAAASTAALVLILAVYSVSFSYLLTTREFTSVFAQNDQSHLDVVCKEGPFKGIRISEAQNTIAEDMIADIREIESKTDGPFTIAGHDATWLQLVSHRRPASFTAWYGQSDINAFPVYYEKTGITPSAVYFPCGHMHTGYFSKSKYAESSDMDFFKDLFDCDIEEGRGGFILWVNGWKK